MIDAKLRETIKTMHAAGKNYVEIKEATGCALTTVAKYAKKRAPISRKTPTNSFKITVKTILNLNGIDDTTKLNILRSLA
jgi:hypothetical protein